MMVSRAETPSDMEVHPSGYSVALTGCVATSGTRIPGSKRPGRVTTGRPNLPAGQRFPAGGRYFGVTSPSPAASSVTKVPATDFPARTGRRIEAGRTLAPPVTVEANGSALVDVSNGISLSSVATEGCSFTIGV
jgi:hypothetical protein